MISEIQAIQRKVAAYYGLTMTELMSRKRDRRVSVPRQVAMYLACTQTGQSFPAIGRMFQRDHTTILHGYNKVQKDLARDEVLQREVSELTDFLAGITYPRDTDAEVRAW